MSEETEGEGGGGRTFTNAIKGIWPITIVSDVFGHSASIKAYWQQKKARGKPYRTPPFNFLSKISHLFKNKMRSTLASSLLEQTAFQRRTESSRRFVDRSSVRTWSNAEMGARKMMASTGWRKRELVPSD